MLYANYPAGEKQLNPQIPLVGTCCKHCSKDFESLATLKKHLAGVKAYNSRVKKKQAKTKESLKQCPFCSNKVRSLQGHFSQCHPDIELEKSEQYAIKSLYSDLGL